MGPKKAKYEQKKWDDSRSYQTHQGSYANRRNADGNEDEGARAGKRKVALVLGYCGAGFQGMQMNPGARTIEAEVENALFSAGAISAQNFGNLAKIGWSRAARTDKGVHAAAQIVACKLCIRAEEGEGAGGKEAEKKEGKDKVEEGKEPPAVSTADDATKEDGEKGSGAAGSGEGGAAKGGEGEGLSESDMDGVRGAINAKLPLGIRVLDIVRVTKPFDARKWCDRRRYVYLLPTFLLMDHEAVLPIVQACVGEKEEVPPTPPAPTEEPSPLDTPTAQGGAAEAGGDEEEDEEEEEGGRGADGYIPPDPAKLKTALEQLSAYRVTPETLASFRALLQLFEGNKRFHNFSTKIDPFSSQAWRKLLSVTAGEPFVEEGVEWVQVTLEGVSFLLYMIRKIIAAAVDGTRGVTTAEVVGQAFGDVRMMVPIAPPDGLYLQKAMFNMYNDRLPADRQRLDYELDPQAKARVADFEREHIVKHILGKEPKSQPFTRWLYNRVFRNKGTYQGTPIEPPPKGGKKRDQGVRMSKEQDALEE